MEDNQIRKKINSIAIPKELNARIMEGFHQAEQERSYPSLRKRQGIKRKIFLVASAAILFVGLFIGSTFVSPAMATIASKIPLFNTVFNRGTIDTALMKHLRKQGFAVSHITQSDYGHEISIALDAKQYINQKEEVEQAAKQYLQQEGYSNIKIKVKKYTEQIVLENIREYPLENTDFLFEIRKQMKKAGFNIKYNQFVIKPKPAELTLLIPESDFNTRKNEIISIVKEAGETYDVGNFKISFKKYSFEQRDRNARWVSIVDTLHDVLLNNKKYSVKSFGFSVKDKVQLYVQLDIRAGDSRAKEKAKITEQDIHKFLSSQKLKKIIKDDHYQIEITSKDGKKIN
ncbi:DUF4030 domain-containing protein [Rummeliibacillus suwonensis]|uniref:DUF4030 domain-containing protein n=1 Tax=Rummeliibacillus suwonensis TaxID=1306154 RepID=UPI001AAFC281|nr:DUF4030 domain-containing protein [Rummeliibacillus suwonensis]MBO2537377.1 DUF4030 domain-containing protein [Rummeliibacillus suwonensis]